MSVDEGEQLRLLANDIEWVLAAARRTPFELAAELISIGWRTRR